MMNQPSKPFPAIRHAFLLLLGVWLLFNLAETVQYISADYSQIPVSDYWRVPQFWPEYKALHFARLWQQHNEHRIVFPELVYITDMFLLHGRMYLPIAISGLCYGGVWFVLAWAAYSRKAIESPLREVALLLAGVVLVWKGCSTLIATPFQLQFTLLQLMVVVALGFLTKAAEAGGLRYLAPAICAAAVGTYSSANGILLWPVLIAVSAFLRLNKRQMKALCVSAILFVGAFFIGYHFLPSQMTANLKHPVQALEFLCSYVSMPFGAPARPLIGFLVGALNLLVMSACFLFARRRGLLRSRLGVVVFGAYLFLLISALLTTDGRMDLNDTLFVQAKQWRYVTMPAEGWALLSIAMVWIVGEARGRRSAMGAAVLTAALFGYGFSQTKGWLDASRTDIQNAQITATMLQNGVFDPVQVRTIFPDSEFVRVQLPILRADRKSIWARGEDKWIGQDVTHLMPDATPLAAKITRVIPVPGGLKLFGWAEDASSLTTDHDVLFVDGDKKIVGFGRRPTAGMPADLSAWDTPNSLAFVGFVSLTRPMQNLTAYVRTFHGKVLRKVEGTIEVPQFTALAERTDKTPLTGINWQPDQSWTLNGYPVSPWNGPAPGGPIYGSWSGVDAGTGTIHSTPFPPPVDHCLVLPVLHGESAYGQLVALRDADTNQAIAAVSMLDGRSVWERWRIPIPDGTRNVSVVAEDQGRGPHQWVAIGAPEPCP